MPLRSPMRPARSTALPTTLLLATALMTVGLTGCSSLTVRMCGGFSEWV